jgi:NlpC/P60 family putative phage cell wall peptidase
MSAKRAAVVAEAESWLGTPYHHMARLKGVGCDCLTLLAAVYEAAGVVPAIEIPFYPPDWHLHRGVERYMDGLLAYAHEVDAPAPGDVALFRSAAAFRMARSSSNGRGSFMPGMPRASCAAMRPSRCSPHGRRGFSTRFLICKSST